MKYIKTFEQFVNENKVSEESKLIKESEELMLNESAALAILVAAQTGVVLGHLLNVTGVADGVTDWIENKIDSVKSTYNRWKKKRMTEETYKEFADKIPALYSQLEKNWKEQVEVLKRDLDAAVAAKQQFLANKGDKRTKEWFKTSSLPSKIQRQIDELEKKDFFKYVYTSEDILKKNKEVFPDLDDATEEQINLIAKMIRDYIKYGKVKDNYWTERNKK